MDLTLVVMAAGVGSRFGGLKQATPIDLDGNFIMGYSVYDAIRAGFTNVVFVIQEEHLDLFQRTIGKRLENNIHVSYAFQKIEDIPKEMELSSRTKAWGTVQAILAAKPYVNGSFVVINADDFYGKNAYFAAADFLLNVEKPFTYANISYEYGITKSLEGFVKRGVLSLEEDKVCSIIECSIGNENGRILATPLFEGKAFEIFDTTPVSMSFFAFQQDIFGLLESYWENYFLQSEEEILAGEVLLPECLKENIKSGKITVYNQPSYSEWIGMTYRSDLPVVEEKMKDLRDRGIYPNCLWENACEK
mgnify:CR=1 FL=1